MYQALLASGAHKAAKILLENISDDDPQVCGVLKACQKTFGKTPSASSKGKKKKNKLVSILEACQGSIGETVSLEACQGNISETVSVKSKRKKKKTKPK